MKSQRVTLLSVLLFLGASIAIGGAITRSFCIHPIILFLSIGTIYHIVQKKRAFGSADYLIVLGESFIIPPELWPFFLILSGAFGIIISIFYKNNRFPFLPAIIASSLILRLL